MNSFEKLDVPIYAKPEEIQKAYENKLNNLNHNKELFSESLYQRKIEELDIAKQECFETFSKTALQKIKIHAKNAYKRRMNPSIMYSSGEECCCFALVEGLCLKSACGEDDDFCSGGCCGCCFESGENPCCSFGAIITYCILAVLTTKCIVELNKEWFEKKQKEFKDKKNEKLRKKGIIRKSAEIKKQNKNIDRDIARYKKLCRQSSCTNKKIKPCKQIVTLLEKMGDEGVNKIKKSLSPYQKCAEEKAEIESKVENIAQLYRDIGNSNAADELLSRLQN